MATEPPLNPAEALKHIRTIIEATADQAYGTPAEPAFREIEAATAAYLKSVGAPPFVSSSGSKAETAKAINMYPRVAELPADGSHHTQSLPDNSQDCYHQELSGLRMNEEQIFAGIALAFSVIFFPVWLFFLKNNMYFAVRRSMFRGYDPIDNFQIIHQFIFPTVVLTMLCFGIVILIIERRCRFISAFGAGIALISTYPYFISLLGFAA